ncbi:hypothetical protein NX02_18040 [Sphingomonas sanxanigenens DSM 19645 = NX02]|uniref:Uncharacterized protein n=1 Tax=Sphingomonas sanxanigenens DSM 19645 = NX02 TaxID=1123269 RepID=W0AFG2_9SPHN|nr:hypothetical protein NX02_18040 [Sphingomonas sanxanigenens DSM 19645 = NX02]
MIPASDWVGIRTILFRQPTRKQSILNPLWGRLIYWGEISTAQRRTIATGPMIILEAVDEDMTMRWSSALDPDSHEQLDRLRADGHAIDFDGRSHRITVTPASARNTQLYRTLPHEIGHWFDWLEKVEGPGARGEPFDALMDRYFARPKAEREAFAHRYADDIYKSLFARDSIPFEQGFNNPTERSAL